MKDFIVKHKYGVCLALFVVIYILYFTTASFLKQDNFFTARFDLGNMDQVVWNTLNGRVFQFTDSVGVGTVSRLAFHADFILILLAPFYLIWNDPKMLLLVQTLVLSSGAIFVYLISNKVIGNKLISLVFAFTYLINPAVNWVNLYDFHPVALATTFLLATFYFLLIKRYLFMAVFLILSGICKEQIWFINFLIGIYIILKTKEKILGITISLVSAVIFYLLIWKFIPGARAEEHFALKFYEDFGATPSEIIKNILFSPGKIVETILKPDRLEFIKQLFLPLGYLSLLAPAFLIFAGPDLLIDLLSNRSSFHQIYYQYTATITPFIFISAIYGVSKLIKFIPEISPKIIAILLLIFALGSAYSFGPTLLARNPNDDMFFQQNKNGKVIHEYLRSVPENLTLSTTNDIGAHLSHRENIFTVPFATDSADMVLFILKEDKKRNPLSLSEIYRAVSENPDYELIHRLDNFYVYQRFAERSGKASKKLDSSY